MIQSALQNLYSYIYTYIYMCVCVCICILLYICMQYMCVCHCLTVSYSVGLYNVVCINLCIGKPVSSILHKPYARGDF